MSEARKTRLHSSADPPPRVESLNIGILCGERDGEQCYDRGESEDSRDASSCPSVGVHHEDDVLFICAETQQSLCEGMQPESQTPQASDNKVPAQEPEDVVLIDDDAEELPLVPKSKKACVECPLCGQRFPLEKIEVHAADCNGASDGDGKSQVRTRSKPRRGAKHNDTGRSNTFTFK
ncbi:BRCA1-A complex subunit RAP80-like, partial [Heptranchias perlo]|uniref:BRCA1-A complex subunit RAP80-like n=1 Tax=Heptranchias perlo TaxID=212740 RepID=UPI003559B6F8